MLTVCVCGVILVIRYTAVDVDLSPFVQKDTETNKDESEMRSLSASPSLNDMVSLHDNLSTFISYVFIFGGHTCYGKTCDLFLFRPTAYTITNVTSFS